MATQTRRVPLVWQARRQHRRRRRSCCSYWSRLAQWRHRPTSKPRPSAVLVANYGATSPATMAGARPPVTATRASRPPCATIAAARPRQAPQACSCYRYARLERERWQRASRSGTAAERSHGGVCGSLPRESERGSILVEKAGRSSTSTGDTCGESCGDSISSQEGVFASPSPTAPCPSPRGSEPFTPSRDASRARGVMHRWSSLSASPSCATAAASTATFCTRGDTSASCVRDDERAESTPPPSCPASSFWRRRRAHCAKAICLGHLHSR
eukprot:scaffold23597_cov29-Tisochrysis_lutea.AAC.2